MLTVLFVIVFKVRLGMAKNKPLLSFVGEWAEIWLKMASSNTEMNNQQPEMKHKKAYSIMINT